MQAVTRRDQRLRAAVRALYVNRVPSRPPARGSLRVSSPRMAHIPGATPRQRAKGSGASRVVIPGCGSAVATAGTANQHAVGGSAERALLEYSRDAETRRLWGADLARAAMTDEMASFFDRFAGSPPRSRRWSSSSAASRAGRRAPRIRAKPNRSGVWRPHGGIVGFEDSSPLAWSRAARRWTPTAPARTSRRGRDDGYGRDEDYGRRTSTSR